MMFENNGQIKQVYGTYLQKRNTDFTMDDEQTPQEEGSKIEATQIEEPPATGCNESLASTTSKRVCILISFGIVSTHALLLWGQIDPQWSIYVCELCSSHDNVP